MDVIKTLHEFVFELHGPRVLEDLRNDAAVSGHLKRQRHGAGNTETKWIYVQEYSSRRWISPLHRKKIVRH